MTHGGFLDLRWFMWSTVLVNWKPVNVNAFFPLSSQEHWEPLGRGTSDNACYGLHCPIEESVNKVGMAAVYPNRATVFRNWICQSHCGCFQDSTRQSCVKCYFLSQFWWHLNLLGSDCSLVIDFWIWLEVRSWPACCWGLSNVWPKPPLTEVLVVCVFLPLVKLSDWGESVIICVNECFKNRSMHTALWEAIGDVVATNSFSVHENLGIPIRKNIFQ